MRPAQTALRRRRRAGALVALSGLDGSGKSTQAEALARALAEHGQAAALVWTRLEWTTLWEGGGALERLAAPAKLVLRARERKRQAAREWWSPPEGGAAAGVRERSPLVNGAWVLVVAVVHALAQRRSVAARLRAGELVVCDRYTLDAAVQLRRRYGPRRRFRLQTQAMHLLSPRPRLAYFLDVDPALALARKRDAFDEPELRAQRELYLQEHAALGVVRLDGSATPAALSALIADDVRRLSRRTGAAGARS
jgi:thymidylate kinase